MVSEPMGTHEVNPRKRKKGRRSRSSFKEFQHLAVDKAENSLSLIPLIPILTDPWRNCKGFVLVVPVWSQITLEVPVPYIHTYIHNFFGKINSQNSVLFLLEMFIVVKVYLKSGILGTRLVA